MCNFLVPGVVIGSVKIIVPKKSVGPIAERRADGFRKIAPKCTPVNENETSHAHANAANIQNLLIFLITSAPTMPMNGIIVGSPTHHTAPPRPVTYRTNAEKAAGLRYVCGMARAGILKPSR